MASLPTESKRTGIDLQWVTPLPPAATGIAQYSRDLLTAVDGSWNVDVYPESDYEDPGWSTVTLRGRHRRRSLDPKQPTILNVGNSGFHEYAYQLARRRGAIVVLHDVVLHFGRLGEYVKRGRSSEYKREMRTRYGEEGLAFAAQLLTGRRPDSFVRFPLCEEFVERSAATVVHSMYARELVKQLVPDATVYVVPMGIPLPALVSRAEARAALGLTDDAFVVASITHVNPFKRISLVLEAFRHVVREVPNALLIIAGSVSPGLDLEGQISRLGLQHCVRLTGYVSDDYARLLARAANAAVNLRYPSAGETSASLMRLLGAGLPVLISDDVAADDYPTSGVIRIPVDVGEVESISSSLVQLAQDCKLCDLLGAEAREFIEREHSMAVAVEGYRAVIAEVSGRVLPQVTDIVLDEQPPAVANTLGEASDLGTTTSWDAAVVDALIALRLDGEGDTIHTIARAMVDLHLDGAGGSMFDNGGRVDEHQLIRSELLEILACPACHGELRIVGRGLKCVACQREYRIDNGIPILIVEDDQ